MPAVSVSSAAAATKPQQNLLRGQDKIFIVVAMVTAFIFAALFLALSGALIARQPLRAKLLPLLRRAR